MKNLLKNIFFIFILCLPSVANSQCSVNAGSDKGICAGQSVQLQGSVPGLTYYWTPSSGLSDSTLLNPVASPTHTTTYYFVSQFQYPSIMYNGDFTAGDTGFTSAYVYHAPPNSSEGQYWVSTNAQVWNIGMSTCGDHTTGNGNMMIVNGSVHVNLSVWCVSLPVTPNTDYAFSCWLTSLYYANPARLQFSINNVPVGNIFNASTTTCLWQQFYVLWNSGSDTVANICIVNQNSVASGNDFALDDVSFTPLCKATDSVTVYISKPVAAFTADPLKSCDTALVIFSDSSSGALNYRWDFGDNVTSTLPSPQHIYTVGQYDVSLIITDSVQCTDTLLKNDYIAVSVSPHASFVSSTTTGCDSLQVMFDNTSTGGISYQWNLGNGQTSTFNTAGSIYYPGHYSVSLIAADSVCADTAIATNLIRVDATPTADFSSVPSYSTMVPYKNNSFTFTNLSTNASTYVWNFGDSLASTAIDPVHSYEQPGNYQVTLIANSVIGCSDTIAHEYTVFEDRKDSAAVYIPNTFTPNGDNVNDVFAFFGYGIKTFELTIFNKWGEIVFVTDNPKGWDGRCGSEQCPQGTYVYHLRVVYKDDSSEDYTGKISLIR
jgi:gliding motility-associated-like protein